MLTPLLFFLLSLRHTLSSAAARSVATSAGLDEELRYRAVPPAMTSSAPARPLRRPSPFAAGWDKLRSAVALPLRSATLLALSVAARRSAMKAREI